MYHADRYACLRCRSTPLAHLKEGETKRATPLFASESLKWPGFVEFDDVNGKVLTFSAQDCIYKVWAMADPTKVLYQFREDCVPSGIAEIKISPGGPQHTACSGSLLSRTRGARSVPLPPSAASRTHASTPRADALALTPSH